MLKCCQIVIISLVLAAPYGLQDVGAVSLKIHKHERPRTVTRRWNTGTGRRQLHERADAEQVDLENSHDLYYSADMTIGKQTFALQLDSGSSDLWVRNTTAFGPDDVKPTSDTIFLSYGTGHLDGALVTANVGLGSITVRDQALLIYQDGEIDNIFQAQLDGLLGLGFDAASRITMRKSSLHTPLMNFFTSNPDEPHTMTFAMSRAGDSGTNDAGLFMIGEPEAQYADVKTAPSNPVYVNTAITDLQRWAIYLDAIEVNGKNITGLRSRAKDAPDGKLVANIDSGTSLAWVPEAAVEAIYSTVPGAVFFKDLNLYTVPCLTQFRVALWFNGVRYPLHPLDITRVGQSKADAHGKKTLLCTGNFVHDGSLEGESSTLDMQLGDVFMRNVITQYDFGDLHDPKTAKIRMLSTVHDELAAMNEFLQSRATAVNVPAPAPVTDLPGDPIPGDSPPPSSPSSTTTTTAATTATTATTSPTSDSAARTSDSAPTADPTSTTTAATATTLTSDPADVPVPTGLPNDPGAEAPAPSVNESSSAGSADGAGPTTTDTGGNGAGSLAPTSLLTTLLLGVFAYLI